jgi:hypothetical protein
MNGEILIYIGAALPFLWGVSHLFPTRSIVRNFGDISPDNRNIIAMEWIVEGIALIFIGLLVFLVTIVESKSESSTVVYLVSACCLIVLAVVSIFTGFKINYLPFKLCPVIFTSSAILIMLGWIMV